MHSDWYDPPKVESGPCCEWCGEEKEYDDLQEVDNSDPSVGYYSIDWMCYDCIYKRGIWRANHS